MAEKAKAVPAKEKEVSGADPSQGTVSNEIAEYNRHKTLYMI
jgi:hypothetical protein